MKNCLNWEQDQYIRGKSFSNFKSIPVKIKKLDDINLKIMIKFIKIDVEGHEIEVIQGGDYVLKIISLYYLSKSKRHTKIC